MWSSNETRFMVHCLILQKHFGKEIWEKAGLCKVKLTEGSNIIIAYLISQLQDGQAKIVGLKKYYFLMPYV